MTTMCVHATIERVRPRDLVCTCMAMDQRELLSRWAARYRPVARRLWRHGHPIDQARVAETMRLMRLIDRGWWPAFAPGNWHRSHHIPGCPFSGRRTPLATVDLSEGAQWASPQ